jgi:hypothetical protein
MYVTELIETFPWIVSQLQSRLPSGEMVTSRPKLVFLRCLLWSTTVLLSLLSDQVLKVLNFGGNVCSPLISVILPVLVALPGLTLLRIPSAVQKYQAAFPGH